MPALRRPQRRPEFTFRRGDLLQVHCESQSEVDHYWTRLSEGGEEGPCGWLKDRFGVSWQIVPTRLMELPSGPDPDIAERAMRAMLAMKKIDIAAIEEAAVGGG